MSHAAARPTIDDPLAVDDLRVRFATRGGMVDAVRGVSFTLGREKLGIVGESGSGQDADRARDPAACTARQASVDREALDFDGIDLLRRPRASDARHPRRGACRWCCRTRSSRSTR